MDFVFEAGGTLRLVREDFSKAATETVGGHTNSEIVRREATEIPDGPTVISTGSLTSTRSSTCGG